MKKRILALIFAAMMALSMTACGGSDTSDTTSQDTTNDTTTAAADDTASNDTEEAFDWSSLEGELTETYMGMSEAGEGVYYGGNADGSLTILIYADPETSQVASFVGPCTDAGEDMLTVTDETTGNTMTFSVAAQDDGTILMDMGEDLGTATIAPCEVSEFLEAAETLDTYGDAVA